MTNDSVIRKSPRKVFVLPEDVDDPQGWGAAWAAIQAENTDLNEKSKIMDLWWDLYRMATRDAAEAARFEVRETSKIGTPENLALEVEISSNPELELVGPDCLDMNQIFEETKWRFKIALESYLNARRA